MSANRSASSRLRSSSLLPPANAAQVWIDFDGTITQKDVLDELIKGYAVDDSWKLAEREWQEGAIGSEQCLRRQFAVVRIADDELDRFVDMIPIDDGIFPLLRLLGRFKVPVAILSDGIDRFIHRILKKNGLTDIPVRSNTIRRNGDGMSLHCPHGSTACESASAHCKCRSIEMLATMTGKKRRRSIYIGDGRSDLCPSRKTDCVFAKGVLAKNLEQENIAFLPYSTLHDVTGILSTVWASTLL